MTKVNFSNIIHQSLIDWDGYVSDVVLFNDCNLRCPYCHNHELLYKTNMVDVEDVMSQIGYIFIDSIVFSGGEPTLQPDALELMVDIALEENKLTAIETNGTNPKVIGRLAGYITQLFVDFKVNPRRLINTNVGMYNTNLAYVEETFEVADECEIPLELRTTCFSNIITHQDIMDMGEYIEEMFTNKPTWVLQQGLADNVLEKHVINENVVYSQDEIKELAELAKEYVDDVYYTTKATGRVKV